MKHYILDFVDDITEDQIQDFAVAHNLTITKTFDHFKHIVLVVGDEAGIDLTAITQSSLVQNFINDSDHDIQLLSTYTLPNDTDPDISFSINDKKNWWKTFSFGQIDFASETLNVKRRGKNVNVYVMDSGIEDTHSEFVGADIVKLYSITGSFDDTVGHGTAIASIISGRTCGLTDATIKVVKIFDPTVATKQSDILAALDAIATDFTSQSSPGIINMSWSIAKNSFIDSRIQSLIDVGAIVVCSAGNSGVPIENVTPASISSALTIGAYNTEFEPCDFSNYTGSSLSLTQNETNRGALDGWAPGIDIWSAGLNDSFYYVSGTSISAAIATCGLAYNFSGALNESQSLHPWANQDAMEIETLSNYVLARKVMLLGPKYGSSTQKVVTIVNNWSELRVAPYIHGRVTKGDYNNCVRIGMPYTLKDITADAIPDGLYFYKECLLGNPTEDLGESGYKLFNIPLTVTLLDGTTDNIILDLVVLSETFDQSQLPPNDPALDVILQLTYICRSSRCDAMACGAYWCNNNGSSKNPSCSCGFI